MGHVACVGRVSNANRTLENLEGCEHFRDQCIDGRIILNWMLKNWIVSITELSWRRMGCSEHDKKSSTKFDEFLHQLSEC
jgi:hypothetical protein